MKSISLLLCSLLLLLSCNLKAQTYPASNFTLVGLVDPETTFNPDGHKYSGCWGWYQASKNKEYAVACSHKGTYWIDVTNPATPTVSAYKAGRKSGCTWREAKSYLNYLYVISDDFGNNSLQIFDMQYLPDSVHKVYDGQTLFARGHTLWIDGDKLYVASVTLGNSYSSMSVFSLANPESPVLLHKLPQDYPLINEVHDMFVRNDTVYASCAYQGLYIFKLTSTNTFSLLGSLTNYPFAGYNHSSALTPNGQTLVFMDEVPSGLPIKIADVSNLGNIQVLATINQYTATTPHNPFMANNQYCFSSSYQDGLQLFDISAPASPSLVGYFDTHPQSGGNTNTWLPGDDYNGQWGAYPFFPSGNIFALDRLNGAFMLSTHLYQTPPVSADFHLPDTACAGSFIKLSNACTGANTFTWTFPAGAVATTSLGEATVSFNATGTYSIALNAANSLFSASVVHTLAIVNNTLVSVASATNAACNSCNTGIAQVQVSGGASPYTYSWSPTGGSASTALNLLPNCYSVSISDKHGCKTTNSVCVAFDANTVGLESLQEKGVASIFPNPAKNKVTVSTAENNFRYKLYTSSGQLVLSGNSSDNGADLDVSEFTKGIYLLELEENKIRSIQKIIIE